MAIAQTPLPLSMHSAHLPARPCPIQQTQEVQCPSSSHFSNTTHEMGDADSHCDGSSSNDAIMRDKSSGTISKGEKYGPRTAQVGMRTKNDRDHHVDMNISDDETTWDEDEKNMKGRRSYVFTMAASSLAWALALIPYWGMYCSHATLSIPKSCEDVLHIGYIFLIITVVIVTTHSSQFKDGNLPDSAGFKLLQIVQVLVLLCLWAGTFIPQHVCRGMSNLVVWTCAAGALFIIVISWALVFQHKTVIIKCIEAPCQMVIKLTKGMYDEKVKKRLLDLSLSECIKPKFKEMLEEKRFPRVPMEPV